MTKRPIKRWLAVASVAGASVSAATALIDAMRERPPPADQPPGTAVTIRTGPNTFTNSNINTVSTGAAVNRE
ncbi:hypothetical protein [Frigidibacter sp. MR17.24]|uniref:hypothetical protein n=1 Tax=Frigidibacter sp. MR17.24 TaxID=3127345 RepID=UPI0030131CC6